MATSKKYFHDHVVLLLLSVLAFFALGSALYVLVSLSTGHSSGYIVQCRDCTNRASISRFTNGSVVSLLALPVFSIIVLAAHTALSLRAYKINRHLAIAVLSLGILLLLLTIIVSYQLLGTR